MDTRVRGAAAEAAILAAMTRHGLSVWLPWSAFSPSDLIIESPAGAISRAQVKSGRVRRRCILANSRSTDHGSGRLPYTGAADILAIWVADIEEAFVVPIAEATGYDVRLRLSPAANNQRVGVRFASDYRLETWAAAFARTG